MSRKDGRGGAGPEPEANRPVSMWGGRFSEPTDALVRRVNASIDVDRALAEEDIEGSLAHAAMLRDQGILEPDDEERIRDGLVNIRDDIRAALRVARGPRGRPHERRACADRAHRAAGGRLHTARSRNDQVATDFRLYLRAASGAWRRCSTPPAPWRTSPSATSTS